ncbi:MAG: AmmeMemoRadiSam system protein A [Phycisphaerales bacterium]|nr:AmmeMemoRadiSam system protein A [Phycisphaerales bacterium]
MTDPLGQSLLRLARNAVIDELNRLPHHASFDISGGSPPTPAECAGAFVTLHHRDRLRGCMGTFQPEHTLADTVYRVARLACRDPRFVRDPVRADELADLTIEVSVLSPLQPAEHPERLEIGKHGIVVRRGDASGCFLPKVAVERGWSAEEFLNQCCTMKAGLNPAAWKQPGTTVSWFTAETYSE